VTTRRTRPRLARAALAAVAALAAAAGCSEPEPDTASTTTAPSPTAEACGADLLACAERGTLGALEGLEGLVPDEPVAADGEPIVLGMINQENTPAGSFPELSGAVEAAVRFVNEQLGGVDGRPIELRVCNTEFSSEGSVACAQQFVEAGVPAVLGGIDVFGTGINTLTDNGIPYVGGIPVSEQSATSPLSFQWSGGTWGATVAFAEYAATELAAERVAIVYGEYGSITESAEYGKAVLDRHGVETQLVPYPIIATDLGSALQAAASFDPDAVVVLAADTGCKPAFEGIAALGLEAATFYVGACAAPTILASLDDAVTEGAIFNVEAPIGADPPDPDLDLYLAVVERYGDGLDPIGAGTVSFRSFMNLYAVLREVGADDLGPDALAEALRSKAGAPSFMGHPYTCDGEQFEGLPALCSPQQVLGQLRDGELHQLGDWIDVGAVYAG
jgi:branched-chain amino acid transport system substrate-binding protein